VLSFRSYGSICKTASCPVRDLLSPRVGNPRFGVSASCPVTVLIRDTTVLVVVNIAEVISAVGVNCLLDAAVVCSRKGALYLTELRTGDMRLLHALAGEIFSSPVVCDAHLIVGCRDNYVYSFHLGDEADSLGN